MANHTTVMTSAKARIQWSVLLDNAIAGTITTIERHGREVAVVLPAEDYKLIETRLYVERLRARAIEAWEDLKQHPEKGIPLDELER